MTCQEKLAHYKGWLAARALELGCQPTCNPYDPGTEEWYSFREGFAEGQA